MPSAFDSVTVSESVFGALLPGQQAEAESLTVSESVALELATASESRIKTLVNDFTLGEHDTVAVDRFIDAVFRDLAWTETLIEITEQEETSVTPTFPVLASKIVTVFWEGRQLDLVSLRTLESFDPQWRDRRGEPIAYLTEGELTRTYRLYPSPDSTGTVTLFHTQLHTAVPQWLELPITFEVLSREYARESNHRDDTMSQLCSKVSEILLGMVK